MIVESPFIWKPQQTCAWSVTPFVRIVLIGILVYSVSKGWYMIKSSRCAYAGLVRSCTKILVYPTVQLAFFKTLLIEHAKSALSDVCYVSPKISAFDVKPISLNYIKINAHAEMACLCLMNHATRHALSNTTLILTIIHVSLVRMDAAYA